MTKKVMVAMSGGVDSTAAAALMIDQGYDVTGATLRLFGAGTDAATADLAVEDARTAAEMLGIRHVVFDVRDAFEQNVIRPFAGAYAAGLTPNPCVDCNKTVKFGVLLQKAQSLGMDAVATGHYACVGYDDTAGRYLLKKAADQKKDQTYVLYTLSQEQLKHVLFPLGALTKDEARALTTARGLHNAQRKESQDICFIPDGDYGNYLENVVGLQAEPGPFVDVDGRVLGRHKGLIRYTIGQRRGLGISAERPKYVVSKDYGSNTIVVGDETDLYTYTATVGSVNLIAASRLDGSVRATVKTRYSQKEAPATLKPLDAETVRVAFDAPQRAVTPGQSAVFYWGRHRFGRRKDPERRPVNKPVNYPFSFDRQEVIMAAIQLSDSVYSVGVLNPAMRIFDIIMQTEYGTSYNAYLIKGEKKRFDRHSPRAFLRRLYR